MIKPLFLGVAVFLLFKKGQERERRRNSISILCELLEIPYVKNLLFNSFLL